MRLPLIVNGSLIHIVADIPGGEAAVAPGPEGGGEQPVSRNEAEMPMKPSGAKTPNNVL